MNIPKDCLYTTSHEWVKAEGNTATVGITDYAQDSLGDVTFVELPETGSKVDQGTECAEVESVKAASDIYAPLTGEIGSTNDDLEGTPELLNQDPYGKGWMFTVKGFDKKQLDDLLGAAAYEDVVKEEEGQ